MTELRSRIRNDWRGFTDMFGLIDEEHVVVLTSDASTVGHGGSIHRVLFSGTRFTESRNPAVAHEAHIGNIGVILLERLPFLTDFGKSQHQLGAGWLDLSAWLAQCWKCSEWIL